MRATLQIFNKGLNVILNFDCRVGMAMYPDNYFDSIVTDPPYELGFVGKKWDASGIAFNVEVWREALRVLKPGGHLLAFSGTRTQHRMVCAIEDAGFEVRDQIGWTYGTGFPKSLDVSKAIDAATGTEGTFGAPKSAAHAGWIDRGRMRGEEGHEGYQRPWMADPAAVDKNARQYVGGSDESRQWQGWGTALKPAWEPICVARKPLIGTVAANVLVHGVGGLNIDGCRVEGESTLREKAAGANQFPHEDDAWEPKAVTVGSAIGRWPANIIHDGSDEVLAAFPNAPGQLAPESFTAPSSKTRNVYGARGRRPGGFGNVGADKGSSAPNGPMYADTGSAARFFYCAKASKSDRGEGNNHPTVKPTDLMRYLCRLVTPPGGTVLDPFAGSGSTGKGAVLEGFQFIGFDLSPEYCAIGNARIDAVRK